MTPLRRWTGFRDAVLLIVGHGSTGCAAAQAPALLQARLLEEKSLFGSVQACFLKAPPVLKTVLPTLPARRLFVAPLFVSEGYFTQVVIPRELGFSNAGLAAPAAWEHGSNGQTLYYCAPLGSHPLLTEVLLERATNLVRQNPACGALRLDHTALFVVGHGTKRHPSSRKAVEEHVKRIRTKGVFGEVHAVFLEEEPRVRGFHGLTAARDVVVVPCFISHGPHAGEDIPLLMGERRHKVRKRLDQGQPPWRNPTRRAGKRVWYAPGIGGEPGIATIILDRVREASRLDPPSGR